MRCHFIESLGQPDQRRLNHMLAPTGALRDHEVPTSLVPARI